MYYKCNHINHFTKVPTSQVLLGIISCPLALITLTDNLLSPLATKTFVSTTFFVFTDPTFEELRMFLGNVCILIYFLDGFVCCIEMNM